MTLPLKEHAITFDIANTMPHIIYCWKALIKVHTHTVYTRLLYMQLWCVYSTCANTVLAYLLKNML